MKRSSKALTFFLLSSIVGFSVLLFALRYHSVLLRSLFFPDRPKKTVQTQRTIPAAEQSYMYGVNVDISQILPTSQQYIVNDDGESMIEIAHRLGVRLLRITNNTKSFDVRTDALYTEQEWKRVLDALQEKNMKALVVIESAGNNPNLFTESIHDDYLQLVSDYVIKSNILSHPALYGIDLKNEPILSDHNVSMMKKAAQMIKTAHADTRLTVGWWGMDTLRKDKNGENRINWEDFAAGRMLEPFVDFYSLHIYGFDKSTFGLYSDPYTYTKRYIANVKRDLKTEKPILLGEFGAANGLAISDQETVGSPQLQANAYAGVYEALEDMDDPQMIGAVSYQFHSQSRSPDAWAIIGEQGNSLLPAAYVLQKYAAGHMEHPFTLPMEPVPEDYLFDNGDDRTRVQMKKDDRAGFTVSLNPLGQYTIVSTDPAVLSLSQPLTYNEKFARYHAVFHASGPGETTVLIQREPQCRKNSDCQTPVETVFSMKCTVSR